MMADEKGSSVAAAPSSPARSAGPAPSEERTDILIRQEGRAGRITLNRPQALNALTEGMARALDGALQDWAVDPAVRLIIIDAAGNRAFCAGGDIVDLHAAGRAGRFEEGQRFWRFEYRMNARIAASEKPVVTLMQGFTMGGGVGVGCHAQVRVVGESSRIAMPECGIGLVPDVGGSYLLARAPGRLGVYLGTCAARMGPADAILAGFADVFVPERDWPALIANLCETGEVRDLDDFRRPPPEGRLASLRPQIDRLFAGRTLGEIWQALSEDTPFAAEARAQLAAVSPLSAACTVAMLRRLGPLPDLTAALAQEYRFTHRAQEQADFLEGIRAAVIDKDRRPRWRHASPDAVSEAEVEAMLAPLGEDEWTPEGSGEGDA